MNCDFDSYGCADSDFSDPPISSFSENSLIPSAMINVASNPIADEMFRLKYRFVPPKEFVDTVFPRGTLSRRYDDFSQRADGDPRFCALALQIYNGKAWPDGRKMCIPKIIYDDHDRIDELLCADQDYVFIYPVSYIGRSTRSDNARMAHAMVIEIDDLIVDEKSGAMDGLSMLFWRWTSDCPWPLPKPTFLVASGAGVHLWFVFDDAVPLNFSTRPILKNIKLQLIEKFWSKTITTESASPQHQGICQGYRLPGTATKYGSTVQAFRIGDLVSLDYLQSFTGIPKKMTMSDYKKLYPSWYQTRIVNQQPQNGNHWRCKPALYNWWLRQIFDKAVEGHRYYCLMILVIYGMKCDIPYDQIKSDCMRLFPVFKSLPSKPENEFTIDDVNAALSIYSRPEYVTFPRSSIAYLSGISIKENIRHYRTQSDHLRRARALELVDFPNYEWAGRECKQQKVESWCDANPCGSIDECCDDTGLSYSTVCKWWPGDKLGHRPDKQNEIFRWRQSHPSGSKNQCVRETGISKPTVYKWWDSADGQI